MYARSTVLGLLLTVAFASNGRSQGVQAAPSDLDRLQGTWQIVMREKSGKLAEAATDAVFMVIRKNDVHTIVEGETVETGTIALSPARDASTHSQYEFKVKSVQDKDAQTTKGGTYHGIYRFQFKGNTFQTSVDLSAGGRHPTSFSSAGAGDQLVVTWRKVAVASGQ